MQLPQPHGDPDSDVELSYYDFSTDEENVDDEQVEEEEDINFTQPTQRAKWTYRISKYKLIEQELSTKRPFIKTTPTLYRGCRVYSEQLKKHFYDIEEQIFIKRATRN